MNKNFEKAQKEKRLKGFPTNLNPILARVENIKTKFKYIDSFEKLGDYLKTFKKNDINNDLIYATAFTRIMQLAHENSYLKILDDETKYYSLLQSPYLNILHNYGLLEHCNSYYLVKAQLKPIVIDFWIDVFARMLDYDKYFSKNGLLYKDAIESIADFEQLSEKIELQKTLGDTSLEVLVLNKI